MPPTSPTPLRFRAFSLALTLLASLTLFPSCAYMQTHKNVRELGQSYQGHQLKKPQQLYRSGGTWYVAATPAEYRLHHDIVHDNVFRKTNEPAMKLLAEHATSPVYHAISNDTATVLLRADGYADTSTLAREIANSPTPWLSTLPHATVHTVKAELAGDDTVPITHDPQPATVPFLYRALSGLDLVLVDTPGTLVYNVAVPFIAPFVFFHEFLSE